MALFISTNLLLFSFRILFSLNSGLKRKDHSCLRILDQAAHENEASMNLLTLNNGGNLSSFLSSKIFVSFSPLLK